MKGLTVPSLATCQALMAAGFTQADYAAGGTQRAYYRDNSGHVADLDRLHAEDLRFDRGETYTLVCAAPVLEEVFDQLPATITHEGLVYGLAFGKSADGSYGAVYEGMHPEGQDPGYDDPRYHVHLWPDSAFLAPLGVEAASGLYLAAQQGGKLAPAEGAA